MSKGREFQIVGAATEKLLELELGSHRVKYPLGNLSGGQVWYFDPGFFRFATILVRICLYCLNCTKFGKLVLRNIIKTVATRCHILRLKCTKFDFGWGSAPDPTEGAYSAPPDPLAVFKGSTSKGREKGKERGVEGKWEGEAGYFD